MTTKLQKFMKKVTKMDKADYSINLISTKWLMTDTPDFFIVLNDYDKEFSQYIDYVYRKGVDNLIEWLRENCDTYTHYGIEEECHRFYFRKENFLVNVEYLSSPLV